MEFTTESEEFDMAMFYDNFCHNLPKIVMVSQGFFGDILEDTFDRFQIIRLETISRQKRVVSKFDQGSQSKLLSIPFTYQEKLCVVQANGKCGKEKFITAIMSENESSLPVTVQFPRDRIITVGSQSISTNHIPPLQLTQTFDEVYFLGNFINDGEMSTEVVHVPLYLPQLRLSIVSGIKGQPKDKWLSYQEELAKVAASIKYDPEFGNKDIALYDPTVIHSDKMYSYIEPERYSNIIHLVKKAQHKFSDAVAPQTYDLQKTQSSHTTTHDKSSYTLLQDHLSINQQDQNGMKAATFEVNTNLDIQASENLENTLESVPQDCSASDIPNLNINQVSAYLRKLRLDKYIRKFREELIDGKMLLDLDKEILLEEFGMKRVEALRLLKFAKEGHLPS